MKLDQKCCYLKVNEWIDNSVPHIPRVLSCCHQWTWCSVGWWPTSSSDLCDTLDSIVFERGRLLAVSHCRGNRSRINHWILRQTYNYTSVGVSIGRGARSPIERQPVISSPPTINHQYATLMSPNQSETAVCGSSIFVG